MLKVQHGCVETELSPTGKTGVNNNAKEAFMKSFKRNICIGLVLAMSLMVATAGLAIAEESVTGTIAAKGDIIVLDAADGLYLLEGSDLTPDMVGKQVTVTGTIEVKNDLRVINVLSMEELKE
jgi:hypothetical protein